MSLLDRPWVGILISLVGAAISLYAYTGDRVYNILFLGVMLVGMAIMFTGAWLTGRSRGTTRRPRRRKTSK